LLFVFGADDEPTLPIGGGGGTRTGAFTFDPGAGDEPTLPIGGGGGTGTGVLPFVFGNDEATSFDGGTAGAALPFDSEAEDEIASFGDDDPLGISLGCIAVGADGVGEEMSDFFSFSL
jgi:hypothetical protein